MEARYHATSSKNVSKKTSGRKIGGRSKCGGTGFVERQTSGNRTRSDNKQNKTRKREKTVNSVRERVTRQRSGGKLRSDNERKKLREPGKRENGKRRSAKDENKKKPSAKRRKRSVRGRPRSGMKGVVNELRT
jgi:hypothetical protein